MADYYTHFNDFGDIEIPPTPELMPNDIKRLFKHNSHTFNYRIYFFSESTKKFYRYFQSYGGYINGVYSRKQTPKASETFYFIPDEDDGTPNTPRRRVLITASKQYLNKIKNMNKIELENSRKKS